VNAEGSAISEVTYRKKHYQGWRHTIEEKGLVRGRKKRREAYVRDWPYGGKIYKASTGLRKNPEEGRRPRTRREKNNEGRVGGPQCSRIRGLMRKFPRRKV